VSGERCGLDTVGNGDSGRENGNEKRTGASS
jgi:hypothetical protein